jgi:hypothetical protein
MIFPFQEILIQQKSPSFNPQGLYAQKIADSILSSQAMTPTSGDSRNSDSPPIGNFRFRSPSCLPGFGVV